MKFKDRLFFAFIPFLICAAATYSAYTNYEKTSRCTATTVGILEENYTLRSTKKLFITIDKAYVVSYRFRVNGEMYMGRDELEDAPTSQIVTVFYNPQRVIENMVKQRYPTVSYILTTIALGLIGVGILLFPFFRKQKSE